MAEFNAALPPRAKLAFATAFALAAIALMGLTLGPGCAPSGATSSTANAPEYLPEPQPPTSETSTEADHQGGRAEAAAPQAAATTASRSPGFLGAGPWPLTTRAIPTPGAGILEAQVVGAATDEGQNLWVVTTSALYLLKPGATTFHRYTAADGLSLANAAPPGIHTVIGGTAGQVFVGYEGYSTSSPTNTDPLRHHGKFDIVNLNANGTLTVHFIDVWDSDTSYYWENRSVRRFVYDHFAHPGTLYVGFSHGVDIVFPDRYTPLQPGQDANAWARSFYGDHVHPRACYHAPCVSTSNSNLRLGEWRGLALDAAGALWMGGRYAAAKINWSSDPMYWIKSWRPYNAFSPSFGDPYPSNAPIFAPPLEGDAVSISGAAVGADGRVWFTSDGAFDSTHAPYGLANYNPSSGQITRLDPVALGLGTQSLIDVAALPDGRLVIAPRGLGLALYSPSTGKVQKLAGLPSGNVRQIWVDAMVTPAAVYAVTDKGLWIGRGLSSPARHGALG